MKPKILIDGMRLKLFKNRIFWISRYRSKKGKIRKRTNDAYRRWDVNDEQPRFKAKAPVNRVLYFDTYEL